MKTPYSRLAFSFALLSAVALIIAGCDSMSDTGGLPTQNASPTMSVEKADNLSQSFAKGTADTEEQLLQQTYDFSATYTDGPNAGASLGGTLSVELSGLADNPLSTQLFRGTLEVSESTTFSARGLILNGTQVYLFVAFDGEDPGLFIGQGTVEEGTFTGTFEGPNLSDDDAGTFTAELVASP